jgi:hypothetical protein
MDKPTAMTICGVPFKVTHPTKMPEHEVGESHATERTIKIKANQKGEEFELTLLHEVIHSILGVSGIAELLDEKTEEAIVICLENGLHTHYQRRGL